MATIGEDSRHDYHYYLPDFFLHRMHTPHTFLGAREAGLHQLRCKSTQKIPNRQAIREIICVYPLYFNRFFEILPSNHLAHEDFNGAMDRDAMLRFSRKTTI